MEKLVTLAKVLSDTNRVKILLLLKREDQLCVCEICDTLQLSQPLVSRHLAQMKKAQLVATHKKGKWSLYSLCKNKILEYLLQELDEKLPSLINCSSKESFNL